MQGHDCPTYALSLLAIVAILVFDPVVAFANFLFGTPSPLGPEINAGDAKSGLSITGDGLALYFGSTRSGGAGQFDLWMSTRESPDDTWGAPTNLGSNVNTSAYEIDPSVSGDDLSLFFADSMPGLSGLRPGGHGNGDLWVSTRESVHDAWGPAQNLGPVINTSFAEQTPYISGDSLTLYFASDRGGSLDIWMTTRQTKQDVWSEPVNLGSVVNSPSSDGSPCLSPDGLFLIFSSGRPPSRYWDLWYSKRTAASLQWQEPILFADDINHAVQDWSPSILPDGSAFYFCSRRSGLVDVFQVSIQPVVDFDGDGTVNDFEMCKMVDSWGTSDPLCDIGPMPWGDGVVDVQDLSVLAEHLGPGFECVAHWALDEASGTTAYDSIGDSDAIVLGDAMWYPLDGKIDGTLQFDGVDDYVSTNFILDPKVQPVRVTCWLRSETPGRAIVSQTQNTGFGATWLGSDSFDGTLMTAMMFPYPALHSSAVIMDGQWHEVAVEWDGTRRRLRLDSREVARDGTSIALPPLPLKGSLSIGVGANLEPDSFFNGLIDDVRIYNRAVKP